MVLARNSLRVFLLLLSTAHLGLALSLRVSRGSPCEAVCPIAADHTSVELRSQICSDSDFYNGQTGTKARGCLDCLKDSNYVLNYVNGSESDLSDLLCGYQINAELPLPMLRQSKDSANSVDPLRQSPLYSQRLLSLKYRRLAGSRQERVHWRRGYLRPFQI
jgi:hypothetical protein